MHLSNPRISAAIAGLALLTGTVAAPTWAVPNSPLVGGSTVPAQGVTATSTQAPSGAVQKLVNEDFKPIPLTQGLPSACPENPKNNREKALKQACGQVGYKEEPPGSNCNKFSRYFGKGCQQWCADFVSWAFDSTGNKDKKLPWSNPSAVASILDWANKTKLVAKTPQQGDIFIIKNSEASHTGLVLKVTGGTFQTIEGNSGNPNVSVTSGQRTVSKYIFVRPD